jgi:alkyldihydroxyacetonephosphate synthase
LINGENQLNLSPARGAGASWWGWGWTDAALPDEECVGLAALLPGLADRPLPVPVMDLKDPRVRAPDAWPVRTSVEPADRAGHTYGKAYRDVMRALRGDLAAAPDWCLPGVEADVVAVLDWAAAEGVAVIPAGPAVVVRWWSTRVGPPGGGQPGHVHNGPGGRVDRVAGPR